MTTSLVRIALFSSALALAACGGEACDPSGAASATPPAAQAPASSTQIHTVADFLVAAPGDAAGAKATSVDALIRDVEAAAESGAWPGRSNAVVQAQGDALVIRAPKAYQDAAASYLTARRATVPPR